MPNIKIPTTREEAVQIHNEINLMVGQESHHEAREQVQKAILTVWPEAAINKTAEGSRDLELNPKQQRAMAEGFLARRLSQGLTGGERAKLIDLAKLCRVSEWVEKHIPKQPIEDFEGLDGEPDLLDAESVLDEEKHVPATAESAA